MSSHTPSSQHVTTAHAQLGHVADSLYNHEPTANPTTTNKTQCILFILFLFMSNLTTSWQLLTYLCGINLYPIN